MYTAKPVLIAAACVAILSCATAMAEEFYKGKTINLIVPSDAGGSFASYSRTVARYMPKHVPGAPAIVAQFKPGAGGVVGANYMTAVAPKDGTEFAAIHAASMHAPMFRGAKFDPTSFQWIGGITPMYGLIAVMSTAPAKNLDEAKTAEVLLAASSKDNETSIIPEIMNKLVGTKFKVVLGYKGGGAMLMAMEQGETHGRVASWDSLESGRPDWLRDGKLSYIVQYGPKNNAIPNVPILKDLLTSESDKKMMDVLEIGMQLGRAYYAPEGVPADRIGILRSAFMATMKDAEFLEQAAKQKLGVAPRGGPELSALVKNAYAAPPEVIGVIRSYMGKN